MKLTETQAQALAAFIGRVRLDWDHPGILAALEKARDAGTPTAIAIALCRLADNHELRTPAMLHQPGQHWAGTTTATRVPPAMCPEHPDTRAARCDIDGPCAESRDGVDHAAGAAAARAALRAVPRECRCANPERRDGDTHCTTCGHPTTQETT